MTTNKVALGDLLKAANETRVNGYLIDSIEHRYGGIARLQCSDKLTVYLNAKQEVMFEGGGCHANDALGGKYYLEFFATRPLTLLDVAP